MYWVTYYLISRLSFDKVIVSVAKDLFLIMRSFGCAHDDFDRVYQYCREQLTAFGTFILFDLKAINTLIRTLILTLLYQASEFLSDQQ